MMLILLSIVIVCLTVLMAETIYFEHKEKMAKSNQFNKLFSKNDKEN